MSGMERRGLEEWLTAGVGMSVREDECATSEDGRSGIAHGWVACLRSGVEERAMREGEGKENRRWAGCKSQTRDAQSGRAPFLVPFSCFCRQNSPGSDPPPSATSHRGTIPLVSSPLLPSRLLSSPSRSHTSRQGPDAWSRKPEGRRDSPPGSSHRASPFLFDMESPKDGIIRHMNKDHPDSVSYVHPHSLTGLICQLARYVEHFCRASRFAARNATLVDLDLGCLVIRCGNTSHRVSLEPPMKAWTEARGRMVQLDREAIRGLDRSPYTVKQYLPPKGVHAVVFAICLATFCMLSRPQHVMPGSIAHEVLLKHVPGLASLVQKLRLLILAIMVAIHLIEVYFMTLKLKEHSVALFSSVWWLWTASNFIEGAGAFRRIDALVLEQRQKGGEKQRSRESEETLIFYFI